MSITIPNQIYKRAAAICDDFPIIDFVTIASIIYADTLHEANKPDPFAPSKPPKRSISMFLEIIRVGILEQLRHSGVLTSTVYIQDSQTLTVTSSSHACADGIQNTTLLTSIHSAQVSARAMEQTSRWQPAVSII